MTTSSTITAAILAAVLLVVAPVAGADEVADDQGAATTLFGPARSDADPVPAERELDALIEANAGRPLTDFSLVELDAALDLVSIAGQQRAHVERSTRISWAIPGLGHYVNGERGTAALFFATEAIVTVATIVGTYLVMPPALQYRNLNYLQTSFAAIETRWKAASASELVPAASVAVSGTLLSVTVRYLAARTARDAAYRALESGTITFEPRPLGGMGLGARR